jgi:hypothetical protein
MLSTLVSNSIETLIDNKNIWLQMRNWLFWVIMLLELIPFYAVGIAFFLLDFILIDKGDEFQLISFITRFKSLFFVSYGLVKGVIQFIQYYLCTVVYSNSCATKGPGSGLFVYPEAAALICQLIIVWVAFFMLQCASPKGFPKFKYKNQYFKEGDEERSSQYKVENSDEDEYEEVRLRRKRSCLCCCICPRYSCCKGDRLVNFLIYDFICFLLVVCYLSYYIFGLHRMESQWEIKTSITFI